MNQKCKQKLLVAFVYEESSVGMYETNQPKSFGNRIGKFKSQEPQETVGRGRSGVSFCGKGHDVSIIRSCVHVLNVVGKGVSV